MVADGSTIGRVLQCTQLPGLDHQLYVPQPVNQYKEKNITRMKKNSLHTTADVAQKAEIFKLRYSFGSKELRNRSQDRSGNEYCTSREPLGFSGISAFTLLYSL
jgi:hypothetical protein